MQEILTTKAIANMQEDELRTELARRYNLVDPKVLDIPKEEMIMALITAIEEVA